MQIPIAHRVRRLAAIALLATSGACDRPAPAREESPPPTTAAADSTRPWDAGLTDDAVGRSVRRGRAILLATRDSLPANVGNDLRCVSCHLDEGRRASSIPWTGVYARFPQYRGRSGRVIRLEDRLNDCLERSMNGRPLPYESDAMRDMVAYMAYLSRGVPVGSEGGGLARLEPRSGDTTRGRAVFAANCVRCHGASGEGTAVAPPLWGARSYNIGAGMARLYTAAAFIKHNMPYDAPTLSEQEAFDVAAYMISQPRPDYPGKELDWPNGDPPPDAAYPTRAGRRGQP